ncbi:zinc-dependent alcohol dehydrogenase family protein [Microbacterium aoyamense]|uniref:Zinc-dependent alcohol dehydrogenase family protein n=1 Tax=Microbacterium aoyamense TaxID=344166 RepID=A0ABN2Q1H1_9MICO|nr:alcohol dehydrogenase catalytic domain-containing protein [Microbacterium aoyamense]
MRAVIVDRFGTLPTIQNVDAPPCPPDGAIVRVEATGVCRSDWHAWRGHDASVVPPYIPGHEFAGVVESVGPEVATFRAGDRVTAPFVFACGDCAQCRTGDHQVCTRQAQPGFTLPGSFADRVVVTNAEINLVALPDGVDFVDAAGLGCRFATAYRAVRARAKVQEGEWVAVHGCGGVGLSAIVIAIAAGARIIATDVSDTALAAAETLGAQTLRAASDAAERIRSLTDGGAHVSIDAFGSAASCVASIESLRPRGRHVQVGLLLAGDAMPAVPMGRVIADELDVLGSHGMSAADYPAMLADIAAGRLDPSLTRGDTIGFDELPHALATMDDPGRRPGMTVAVRH